MCDLTRTYQQTLLAIFQACVVSGVAPCRDGFERLPFILTRHVWPLLLMCPRTMSIITKYTMNASKLRSIRRCAQWIPKNEIKLVPSGLRGIYTLYWHLPRQNKYDVVYVGMAGGDGPGIQGRLIAHANSRRKRSLWSHFSIFEVWPNITESEIEELEGLFREIYRKDSRANRLNRQKRYGNLQRVRVRDWRKWHDQENRR